MCLTREMKAGLTIILVIVTRTFAICDKENSVELTNRAYNGITYEGEYLVDNSTGIERGCVCEKERCIRKCCPLNQAYDEDKKRCVDFSEEFSTQVYDMRSYLIPGFNVSKEFHFLFNNITCREDEARVSLLSIMRDYHIKKDGQLYTIRDNYSPSHFVYSSSRYCVDNFISEDTNKSSIFNGFICIQVIPGENHLVLSCSCMLISCILIIPLIAVYLLLPELRTLHGMIMIAYFLSFFSASFVLAIMEILLIIDKINQTRCVGFTFVIYFSLLSAFCWLNVMCFDLWSKLRIKNMAHGFPQPKNVRFLMYTAYALGLPAALTVLLAALEFSNLPVDIKLLPHLRSKECFIGGSSKVLYLYGPIITLFMANLVLFILTATRLSKIKKETQILNKQDTQRMSLYIKLFIVTGVDWLLEVCSTIWNKLPFFEEYTDIDDIIIVIIYFILFLGKKKIFIAIKNRFQTLMGKEQSGSLTNVTTTSSLNQLSEYEVEMQTQPE